MNGLDLFSGIGGITKALEGYVTPVAYCENDRYAQAVLLSRMADGSLPVAPIWDDVRTLQGVNMGAVDIICGGFPCQDISVAGRGAGLEGERSGLFFEIARLVGEIRPRFVFLENVPAITTRGECRVVGELAALGYDARWITLSAAEVGANHIRDRWWLLAHAKCTERRPVTEGRHESNGDDAGREKATGRVGKRSKNVANAKTMQRQGKQRSESHGVLSPDVPNADPGRRPGWTGQQRPGWWREFENGRWWQFEPDMGRVAHGVPFRVDRLRGLGNAVVPAQAREAFERLMGIYG